MNTRISIFLDFIWLQRKHNDSNEYCAKQRFEKKYKVKLQRYGSRQLGVPDYWFKDNDGNLNYVEFKHEGTGLSRNQVKWATEFMQDAEGIFYWLVYTYKTGSTKKYYNEHREEISIRRKEKYKINREEILRKAKEQRIKTKEGLAKYSW